MVAWLIEYRDPELQRTTGYIYDIDTDGKYAVMLTADPYKAIKFSSQHEAQSILDDWGFIRAMGSNHNLVVCDHCFIETMTTPTEAV